MMNTTLFTAIINVLNNLDDTQGAQLLSIASGMTSMSQPVLQMPQTHQKSELHLEEDSKKKDTLEIEGKVVWQEDFCTVTNIEKKYRLYITCPVKGDKGEKIRYAIKKNAKENYGVKWAGEYGTGKIYWEFPDAKTAKQFISDRKERAKEA